MNALPMPPHTDALERFSIHVEDAVWDDLRRRLAATRWPDQVEGADWDYGAELAYVRELCAYWRDVYDWRAAERELNRYEHYRTSIDGQRIHFLHAPSRHKDALPLLISHGWPGSIAEFMDVIEPLRDPEAHGGRKEDAFHVVCPSLPGYGFSEPTRTRGWDPARIADAFAVLMQRIGYARYGAQGGDWGALVTSLIGLNDAAHVAGIHVNMPLAVPADTGELSDAEKADLATMAQWQDQEAGYQRIQGTKPQTLGFGLMDSPAGLAAWIIEKFRSWSDCGGHPENAITRDRLLTNIAIYWATGTITSSTRLYYETFRSQRMDFFTKKVTVPTGVARFPKEIMRFPRKWVEQRYNVTHWSEMPRGGHFAAMEQPALFVEDVRRFFRTVR
jgi:pimeloyl-ACP methyl ester carboxylesterase